MKNISSNRITIHKIPVLPFGMINAFLVSTAKRCVLIDTGLPGTENKINSVLKKLNLSFSDIKLIIITHAHIDHAGNTAKIKSLSGAPVVAHEGDLPYFMGEREMHFCSTGWFGWLFSKTGAIQKKYTSFRPDVLLTPKDTLSLDNYGIEGLVIPTPGHTEGSISVVIENKEAVVGDLISSGILLGGIVRTDKAKRPPFEDNPLQVSQELASIVDRGVETFFMGHGGPLPQQEILRHIEKLQTIASPSYATK